MHGVETVLSPDKNGVLVPANVVEFQYSDGDREEQYLLKVIKSATDITSDSKELEGFIRDWSSKYHLSRERSNAYRTLDINKNTKILEIGCGCGSISRYLGETGAEVLAVEGSYRRAQITRERTRDQENVSVVCAPFDSLEFSPDFDLIVCNGVLEYSPYFVDSQSPFDTFLSRCSSALAPDGTVAVAIENQFGLRYFSSGKEEHTNLMFDGLEGYPGRDVSARTFDRETLKRLLERNIGPTRVLLPIPDYKLPRALISEEFCQRVNCGELFADLQSYDFGSVVNASIHERLVYHELGKSSLISHMANSFFMLAGEGAKSLTSPEWMGSIYKIRASSSTVQKTDIVADESGSIKVRGVTQNHSALGCDESPVEASLLECWVSGESVHTTMSRAICSKNASVAQEKMRLSINIWWSALPRTFVAGVETFQASHVDAIWRNSKIVEGKVEFFDQEWLSQEEVDRGWMIYRAAIQFIQSERPFLARWNRSFAWWPALFFLKHIGKIVDVEIRVTEIWGIIQKEINFQKYASEVTFNKFNKWKMFVSLFVPMRLYSYKLSLSRFLMKIKTKLLRVSPRTS